MGVYIGTVDDYSAMQGPCDTGFHIPTIAQWGLVFNAGKNMGIWSATALTNFSSYLKLPLAGEWKYSYNYISGRGTRGCYWSSTPWTWGPSGNACGLQFTTSSIDYGSGLTISYTFSIRPFKDVPVTPDSSRTVLYQGAGTAGIYHNSSHGLISISGDGSTRYTMADKNLGATTVYNSGDTLSANNCGLLYQRGNNYGFPFSGPTSTSSSQVNASTYGPGNYYSNSTARTVAPRESSNNKNLRGGETGAVQVGQELKNAYIGEYVPPLPPELCFTANTANSTVKLGRTGSPASVSLETSTDGTTWSSYSFGVITLSNVGDKVYFRSTSSTDTAFSTGFNSYYKFTMSGSIAASGDVSYLLNKNGTNTMSSYCFVNLFYECTSLTSTPRLPATNLAPNCYNEMFYGCTSLTTLPALPATTLADQCYYFMFGFCSNIKISGTQSSSYPNPYRIPTTGTGSSGSYSVYMMFSTTGGTFVGTPYINQTYYTSNTVV